MVAVVVQGQRRAREGKGIPARPSTADGCDAMSGCDSPRGRCRGHGRRRRTGGREEGGIPVVIVIVTDSIDVAVVVVVGSSIPLIVRMGGGGTRQTHEEFGLATHVAIVPVQVSVVVHDGSQSVGKADQRTQFTGGRRGNRGSTGGAGAGAGSATHIATTRTHRGRPRPAQRLGRTTTTYHNLFIHCVQWRWTDSVWLD